MTFRGKKLSDKSILDVLLADITDEDFVYFVDKETDTTMRLRIGVLRTAMGGGGGGGSLSVRRLTDADGVAGTGPLDGFLVFQLLLADNRNIVWLEDSGDSDVYKYAWLPADTTIGTQIRIDNFPAPGTEAGEDSFVYAGTYPNPGAIIYNGAPLDDNYLWIPTGNAVTFTRVDTTSGTPSWEAVLDYALEPAAHADTHMGGSDPITPGGIGAMAVLSGPPESGIVLVTNYSGSAVSSGITLDTLRTRGGVAKVFTGGLTTTPFQGLYASFPDAVSALRAFVGTGSGVIEILEGIYASTGSGTIDLEKLHLTATAPDTAIYFADGYHYNPSSLTNLVLQIPGPGGSCRFTKTFLSTFQNCSVLANEISGDTVSITAGTVRLRLINSQVTGGRPAITVATGATLIVDLYGSTLGANTISGAGNVTINYCTAGPASSDTHSGVSGTLTVNRVALPSTIGALPAPGGTTTSGGIVTGSGTAGAAIAVSTTTIADVVKCLGLVFTLSADTVLSDTHSGSVIFTDTSGGARSLTIPTTVSAGWNAVIVREGANALNIIGDGTMLMAGPAAAANAVAIAVDNGGVSVIRRSATKCWCAGVIA